VTDASHLANQAQALSICSVAHGARRDKRYAATMTSDAHGRSSQNPTSFSDDDVPALSHAERARTLVAGQTTGSLATIALEPAGHPYASFVTFALDAGQPVFLISRIAEHTRNLMGDPRASLLVHESGQADPLANARVTLVGRALRLSRAQSDAPRAAFLEAHPQSAYYVDYADFDFWSLGVTAVRYIGGYGRMSWVDTEDFIRAQPDPLATSAEGVIAHMNDDHAGALRHYAQAFTRAVDAERATMTAIDRHGFEMTVTTPAGVGPARIAFAQPLTSAGQARQVLIDLLRAAEAKLGRSAER
jgi:heme iron utilization protein